MVWRFCAGRFGVGLVAVERGVRRTVISDTPSCAAISVTDTAPVSATASKMKARRVRARTFVLSIVCVSASWPAIIGLSFI